jgi:autotransporter passenger strand-loop-strand repeat protein
VRTLVAEELSAGGHQVVWNGLDASGAQVSSGVYFYRLQAGSQVQMRRMLLLK